MHEEASINHALMLRFYLERVRVRVEQSGIVLDEPSEISLGILDRIGVPRARESSEQRYEEEEEECVYLSFQFLYKKST